MNCLNVVVLENAGIDQRVGYKNAIVNGCYSTCDPPYFFIPAEYGT